MKYLSEEEITNKKVLLRCDFNVPVKDGNICDDSKITKSLATINYLLKNNNRVILLSHFGRVKSEEDKEKNSLKIVYEYLKKYYDLEFVSNPLDLTMVNNSSKKLFLVENTRYTDVPEKRESANDLELAKYWASFADVFVVDAFASLHRAHSSTAGISKYLPTFLGFLVEKEIENLKPLINNENHPFVVIMGGAKVDDKIKIIEGMLKKCDKLVLTGGILNSFLKVMNYHIGNSLASNDAEVLESVKKILNESASKIVFSPMVIVKRGNTNMEIDIQNIEDKDIIYDNVIDDRVKEVIDDAKVIFLNGTPGLYESEEYSKGTKSLLEILSKSGARVYVGGGDTASAVNKFNYANEFTYVSSGGGATLEYVSDGKLKALEFIKENGVEN